MMSVKLAQLEKVEMIDKVRSVIMWCLKDKELSEVTKEKIVVVMCIPKDLVSLERR